MTTTIPMTTNPITTPKIKSLKRLMPKMLTRRVSWGPTPKSLAILLTNLPRRAAENISRAEVSRGRAGVVCTSSAE
jgi:hypothetical protein